MNKIFYPDNQVLLTNPKVEDGLKFHRVHIKSKNFSISIRLGNDQHSNEFRTENFGLWFECENGVHIYNGNNLSDDEKQFLIDNVQLAWNSRRTFDIRLQHPTIENKIIGLHFYGVYNA